MRASGGAPAVSRRRAAATDPDQPTRLIQEVRNAREYGVSSRW